ncbi:patatin-like phospholipase family protein [Anaerobacillus isosaccharinicus]|uniref:Patatin-like phospholipase family protein n=1 Tax=Anaerobacillus isosaccharinicus TaxID=1532552 RepID=A0A7S7RAY2_9BACI|nr:patatin-like phospholipase family protein [Anaerobacillus isosaccharinicus]MBA5586426.1 patatin-like phospholipase family protein [Anaerobacillus isosaccharinicus]QOY35331.1 patatin-like phospholipase family protein [Anaerobacillus isosaccharinicus]
MKVDGVFEGGGIKGIAHVGAISVVEEAGYKWERLAGTSAGSIVAALLAVGYNASEIQELMLQFPFEKVEQKALLTKLPIAGPILSLLFTNGIYKLTFFEQWLEEALRRKGKRTFGDLPENKLKIIITDISNSRMSILPDDLPFYGVDPKTFPIARAVKMSSSIPFFFVPEKLKGHTIIDGGALSNYPIWIYDSVGIPRWPTFGFRLSGKMIPTELPKIRGPVSKTMAIVRTMLDAHDKRYIEKEAAIRTIFITGITNGATDFRIPQKDKLQLIEIGRNSAIKFLQEWDFQKYIKEYRSEIIAENLTLPPPKSVVIKMGTRGQVHCPTL